MRLTSFVLGDTSSSTEPLRLLRSSQTSEDQQLDQHIKHVKSKRHHRADTAAQQLRLSDPPVIHL